MEAELVTGTLLDFQTRKRIEKDRQVQPITEEEAQQRSQRMAEVLGKALVEKVEQKDEDDAIRAGNAMHCVQSMRNAIISGAREMVALMKDGSGKWTWYAVNLTDDPVGFYMAIEPVYKGAKKALDKHLTVTGETDE